MSLENHRGEANVIREPTRAIALMLDDTAHLQCRPHHLFGQPSGRQLGNRTGLSRRMEPSVVLSAANIVDWSISLVASVPTTTILFGRVEWQHQAAMSCAMEILCECSTRSDSALQGVGIHDGGAEAKNNRRLPERPSRTRLLET